MLLRPAAVTTTGLGTTEAVTPTAEEAAARTTTALDGNAALASVGDTVFGRLWQHEVTDAPVATAANGAIPAHAGGTLGLVFFFITVLVIGATVLLSIPTGAGPEAVRQAGRDAIRHTAKARTKQNKRLAKAAARLKPAPGFIPFAQSDATGSGARDPAARNAPESGSAPDTESPSDVGISPRSEEHDHAQ